MYVMTDYNKPWSMDSQDMGPLPSLSTRRVKLPSALIQAAVDMHILCSVTELLFSSSEMLQAAVQAGINFPFSSMPLVKPPPSLTKHCCKNDNSETAILVHEDYLSNIYLKPAGPSPLSASLDKPVSVSFVFTAHFGGYNYLFDLTIV